MLKYKLEITEKPREEDLGALVKGLDDSVPKDVGPRNYRRLGIYLRDSKGNIVAGFDGSTWWGWLNISLLWVAEPLRKLGYGEKLMKEAEKVAMERGCHSAVVDTTTFQARGFYEKLGYKVFGTLEDVPKGHKRFYLQKIFNRVANAF